MTNFKIFGLQLFFAITASSFLNDAMAERVVDESTITIKGEQRRYYRLHDSEPLGDLPVILLIGGSGCGDFGSRLPVYFEKYPAPSISISLKSRIYKKRRMGADAQRHTTRPINWIVVYLTPWILWHWSGTSDARRPLHRHSGLL